MPFSKRGYDSALAVLFWSFMTFCAKYILHFRTAAKSTRNTYTPPLSAPEFWMTRWAPRSPTQPHDAPVPRKNLEHILLSPGYPKFPQDSPSFPHESPELPGLPPDFPYDSSLILTFPDFPQVSPDKRLFLKFWNVPLSLHIISFRIKRILYSSVRLKL